MTMRFYTVDDIAYAARFTRAGVYAQVRDGVLPEPIKFGKRASRWIADEVDAIFAAREQSKSDDELRALVANMHAARTSAPAS